MQGSILNISHSPHYEKKGQRESHPARTWGLHPCPALTEGKLALHPLFLLFIVSHKASREIETLWDLGLH